MRETGGMNPSPASSQKVCGKFVGGGVPDAPRRGQDPSLRCKPVKGIQRQGCGPGMPGPYGLLFPAAGVRGRLAALGGAQRAPPVCCANPLVRLIALPSFAALNCGPTRTTPQHPNFKPEEGSAALRTDSNTASV